MPPDGTFKSAYSDLKEARQLGSKAPRNRGKDFSPLPIPQLANEETENAHAVSTATDGAETPASPILYGLAARLAKLMTDLTAIIAQETSLLKNRQSRDAQALHGTKNRMIVEYKQTIDRLKLNQQSLGEQESDIRVYLKDLGEKLKAALKDHARIVIRLKNLTEGIIKSVGEEVAKRERPVVNYGKSAHLAPSKMAKPMSLALNELI